MTTRLRTDRRPPQRGDLRRDSLLAALDELLRDSDGKLEPINVAEIARRAGLTRSAFYFYFENKAAAVAARLDEMFTEVVAVNDILVGDGEPADRIERTIRGLVAFWDLRRHLFRPVLEARNTSETLREVWEAHRQAFIPSIAAMIEQERAAGRATAGPDATALADVLLLLNERLLERLSLAEELDNESYIQAVIATWMRTIYGRTPAEAEGTTP